MPDDPDDLQADLEALAGPGAGPNGAQFFIDGFSGGQLPPKSSIREIRINSNPFSSEFDRPGFGRIEILTKPGTENFHGQVFVNYGNKVFDSRNPLLTTDEAGLQVRAVQRQRGRPHHQQEGVVHPRFPKRHIDENALIVGQVLDSSFNIVPFNQAVLTPNLQWQINPRIDYPLNAWNTLVMRYNHSPSSNVGGVGGFKLPTQETQGFSKNNQVQITETTVIGTVAVDETRFQFRNNNSNTNAIGAGDIPGVNVSGAFNSGGAPFVGGNYNDNRGYELNNILTFSRGAHALKVGARMRQTDIFSKATSNFNGSWSFNTPNTLNGIPQCLQSYGSNPTSLDLYQQTQELLSKRDDPAGARGGLRTQPVHALKRYPACRMSASSISALSCRTTGGSSPISR